MFVYGHDTGGKSSHWAHLENDIHKAKAQYHDNILSEHVVKADEELVERRQMPRRSIDFVGRHSARVSRVKRYAAHPD